VNVSAAQLTRNVTLTACEQQLTHVSLLCCCYCRSELLGMVGVFGMAISGIQFLALERQEMADGGHFSKVSTAAFDLQCLHYSGC
jgi:hypothetical protein